MFLATYICKVQRPPVRCHYILGPFKEKTSSAPSETGANHFISVSASFTIAVLVGCLFLWVLILQSFTVAGMYFTIVKGCVVCGCGAIFTLEVYSFYYRGASGLSFPTGCNFTSVYSCGNAFTVVGICLLLRYDVFTIAVQGRFASRRKTALRRHVKYYS